MHAHRIHPHILHPNRDRSHHLLITTAADSGRGGFGEPTSTNLSKLCPVCTLEKEEQLVEESSFAENLSSALAHPAVHDTKDGANFPGTQEPKPTPWIYFCLILDGLDPRIQVTRETTRQIHYQNFRATGSTETSKTSI